MALVALTVCPSVVLADGTDLLGEPVGLTVAPGSDILISGVGLLEGQPGTIELEIPAGVTIQQALLYWEGQEETPEGQGDTDTIMLNESIEIVGSRIGGPSGFRPNRFTSTYRYDLTDLGLLQPGPNSLSVSGLDFNMVNNGAGLLVIVDDGVTTAELQLRDGNDFAFYNFPAPFTTTEPVTFTFAPADAERTASLDLFLSSVALEDPSGNFGRPSVIAISIDDVLVEELVDQLANSNGPEWDSLEHDIVIPAGATSLTIQALSQDAGTGPFAGNLPASLTWLTAGLTLETIQDEPEGGEGCAALYWMYWRNYDEWPAPYTPNTLFSDVFEDAFPGKTLKQVLRGSGYDFALRAMGRQAVAALLNAASDEVSYDLSVNEVVDMFNDAYPGDWRDYFELKFYLLEFNNQDCPLQECRHHGHCGCGRHGRHGRRPR